MSRPGEVPEIVERSAAASNPFEMCPHRSCDLLSMRSTDVWVAQRRESARLQTERTGCHGAIRTRDASRALASRVSRSGALYQVTVFFSAGAAQYPNGLETEGAQEELRPQAGFRDGRPQPAAVAQLRDQPFDEGAADALPPPAGIDPEVEYFNLHGRRHGARQG